jgi:hypothetical protein
MLVLQDPNYCPPEQYVLPTDAPHLAKSMLSVAISPMLWAQYKPDRFDMWSAGGWVLVAAVPQLVQQVTLTQYQVNASATLLQRRRLHAPAVCPQHAAR